MTWAQRTENSDLGYEFMGHTFIDNIIFYLDLQFFLKKINPQKYFYYLKCGAFCRIKHDFWRPLNPVSVTWKSQFCNRAFRLWRSTSRWGCSCIHSTGRTWRARLCPARWGGTGPRWAVRTQHSEPSYRRPAGCRVPTYPRGLRCSDLGKPGLRGTTSWLREVCC